MADIQTVHAYARGVTQTPRKVGLVASLVRGRNVADALVILEHTPKRAAKALSKTIASAKANATSTYNIDEQTLVISELQVSAGPRLKRFRPAAMGRALPYQKRTSHIQVSLSGTVKPKKTTAKTETAAKTSKTTKVKESA